MTALSIKPKDGGGYVVTLDGRDVSGEIVGLTLTMTPGLAALVVEHTPIEHVTVEAEVTVMPEVDP